MNVNDNEIRVMQIHNKDLGLFLQYLLVNGVLE